MLFCFSAKIGLPDLPAALSHWLRLLQQSPLESVSQLKRRG